MKKILALVLALALALCAMSVSVFAEEIVLLEDANGWAQVDPAAPWDGFGIGVAVNDKLVGDITLDDVKAIAAAGGAKLVLEFSCSSIATWQTTSPEAQFNCWDNEEALQVNSELTELGDNRYIATFEFDALVANLEAAGLTLDGVNNLGIQVWANDFVLYSAKIVTDGDAAVETPAEEEAPATEEAPVEEETVVEEPTTEEAPAETGLALAVVPMIVAAVAVVASKRR